MSKIGRPYKYEHVLRSLEDDTLYSASAIATFAEQNELIGGQTPEEQKLARRRIRTAMIRLCNNHNFPDDGDGKVNIPGQAPVPGWFGSRWKSVLSP